MDPMGDIRRSATIHIADGIPVCGGGCGGCGSGAARGGSALFVGGFFESVDLDLVSTVVMAIAEKGGGDEGGGDDGRAEADPVVKKNTTAAVEMRRRDSWECILP